MILLDTHVVFWATTQPDRLSRAATRAIRAAERAEGLAISSISLWELAWLMAAGRVRVEGSMEGFLNKVATRAGLAVLDVTPEIAVLAAQFPPNFPGDSNRSADRRHGARPWPDAGHEGRAHAE